VATVTRALGEIPARRGQSNIVGIALKYCDGQYTLKLSNLLAQRRLRHVTLIGGAIEAQQIGNRDSVLKLPKGICVRTEIRDRWSLSQ